MSSRDHVAPLSRLPVRNVIQAHFLHIVIVVQDGVVARRDVIPGDRPPVPGIVVLPKHLDRRDRSQYQQYGAQARQCMIGSHARVAVQMTRAVLGTMTARIL